MDIEFFLKQRTAFIRYFYEESVKPFDKIKAAIEKEEAPYIPLYSEDGEPQFLEEWMNADQGVDAVGHACISMLSSSLQLFLKSWVDRLEKDDGMKFDANFKKGWFNGYRGNGSDDSNIREIKQWSRQNKINLTDWVIGYPACYLE